MYIIDKLKEILLKNIYLKVLSIILAFMLWAYVNSTIQTTASFLIPIKYENLPGRFKIDQTYSNIQEVEVFFTGNQKDIIKIEEDKLLVQVDLANTAKGKRKVLLSDNNINLKKDMLRIVKINPRSYTINIIEKEKVLK